MLARSPMRPARIDRRPSTLIERRARAAAARSRLDEILRAASPRGFVGCGDLASTRDRRSPFFKNLPERERFGLSFVIAEDGCWNWVGARKPKGYGQFRYRRSNWNAHRVAYVLYVGPIPDGLDLDHLCLNKGCVNPEHLDPVTGAENTRRYGLTITHCPKGHPRTPDGRGRNNRGCRQCHNHRTSISGKIRSRRRRVSQAVMDLLADRSGGFCEIRRSQCSGLAIDPAHRISVKGGGRRIGNPLDGPDNLLYACRRCHTWSHENPAESYEIGVMLREGMRPQSEPVFLRGERWLYLAADGSYSDNPPGGSDD